MLAIVAVFCENNPQKEPETQHLLGPADHVVTDIFVSRWKNVPRLLCVVRRGFVALYLQHDDKE